jgi:ABC-type Na+ efflux pump permease subunit
MKIKGIKQLAWLEFHENRRRIWGSMPVLMLFSLTGFILPLVRTTAADDQLILRLSEIYRLTFSDLSPLELKHIILTDLRLPLILLTAAWVSPFLGVLDSIVSEKEKRTIENLFVLPLSDAEIISGKMIICTLVGMILSWLVWISHYFFLWIYSSFRVANHVLQLNWLVLNFQVLPACALCMNLIGIILAVQVRKAQTGYNLGMILFFPLAIILAMIGLGAWQLSLQNLYMGFSILAIGDIILFKIAFRVFDRERILLKYR